MAELIFADLAKDTGMPVVCHKCGKLKNCTRTEQWRVVEIIGCIPQGKVIAYGLIPGRVGDLNGARQVSRVLHSSSAKFDLPWHRVVNWKGEISFRPSEDYFRQPWLLDEKGAMFKEQGRIY